jgi:hypothetical protein
MPIYPPNFNGDPANAIKPTDARPTLVSGDLLHVLGAMLIAHLSFFECDALALLGRAA